MFENRSDKLPWMPVAALWLAISAIMIITGWDNIVTRSGWDPDDQLRMVQLRDFLAGQSWFDITQYRMNGDAGAPMHWSRLIELPLALIVILLSPLIGQAGAEMVAGTAVPLLGLGLVAWMIGRNTTQLASREAGIVAVLVTLLSPALLMQFRPMRIDHHGWQIVMATLALWTIFWPNKKRGGIVLGIALAIWLHISLEGAPLTAAFFLLLGWRWIFEKAHGQRLIWTISSFAGASFLLFFGTQNSPLGAPAFCDTVSPPHIAAIALAAAIMLPAIMATPKDWRIRLGAAALAGAAALGTLLLLAPQCSAGAFGNLDPLVRDYWYVHVNEGLPVWHQNFGAASALLAAPICALITMMFLLREAAGATRKQLRVAAFFMLYSALLSLLVFRTVSVASAFAVPAVAVFIVTLFHNYRRSKEPVRRVAMVAVMLSLLVPGAIAGQLSALAVPKAKAKGEQQGEATAQQCESAASVAALSALPNARILAPFDMGPMILLTTPHEVLASSHHRNEGAMHDQIEIFLSQPAKAKAVIDRRKITHIALCPGEAELDNYKHKNPGGLWSQMDAGKAPLWLEPMKPVGGGIQVWRVKN
ncbi:hypothetical protein ACFOWX_11630 [Sphingorhabdus arenilitoris]|uniref:AcrB/AcrD/AcrF family protein n=1 Tax=Sphingorhabdus arenilitoris TaxID=1490041 RepID=A0ABV8RKP4_9SPHN